MMSGVILGCAVEASGARCCRVWLLVLKAGLPIFETGSMLISADVVRWSSTRWDRQSAALFLVGCQFKSPSIYFVICILSIQKLNEWLVIILDNDVFTLEIVIPFGYSILNSMGLLFSCTPLSLGLQKV